MQLFIDTTAKKALKSMMPTQYSSSPTPPDYVTAPVADVYQGGSLPLDAYFLSPSTDKFSPFKLDRYAAATVTAKLRLATPILGIFRLASQTLATELTPGTTTITSSRDRIFSNSAPFANEVEHFVFNGQAATGFFYLANSAGGNSDAIYLNMTDSDVRTALTELGATAGTSTSQIIIPSHALWIPGQRLSVGWAIAGGGMYGLEFPPWVADATGIQWLYGWRGTLSVGALADPLFAAGAVSIPVVLDIVLNGQTVFSVKINLLRA